MKKSYGPWRGFQSSRSRYRIDEDALGPDSQGALINPLERYFYRRGGSAALCASTGCLEMVLADATMKSMHAFSLKSPSLTDGYSAPAVVWADESKRFGQVYFRSSNGAGTDQVFGKSVSATHYPWLTNGTSTNQSNHYKMVPVPYLHNATGYTRGVFEQNRRYFAAGSRRVEQVGNWLYAPNYYGTPMRSNRKFNDASGSGTELERHFPTGAFPCLWPPTIAAGTGLATVAPWQQNEQFWVSCAFMFEDGAIWAPFLPRAVNATLTSGLGLVALPTTNPYYKSITWTVPIGPDGTIARVLLRSPKVLSTASPYIPPDISDLRVTAILRNNTATTYSDTNGSDGSLLADPERIRFDHKLPDRARTIFTFDQRIAIADLAPNPVAVFIAPLQISATPADMNATDDSATVFGTISGLVNVQSNRILLRQANGGATVSTKIDLSSSKTVQDVVDEINATTRSATSIQWCAQVAPGADGNAASTMLAPFSQNVVCATTNTSPTVTSAALFGPVAVGTRITGTGVTAGTYVKSIESTSSLTMSANATATGAPTLTFYSDFGDDPIIAANADATYTGNIDKSGNQRIICPALPGTIGFTKAYLDAFQDSPQDMLFTGASPGHAPNAANNYYVGNRRSLPGRGRAVAGGHVQTGNIVGVVAFTDGVGVIRNMSAGGSGRDADYRLLASSSRRGCISPPSFVQGNGWVSWLAVDGPVATAGEAADEALIGLDNFLPNEGGGIGEWAYEIGQSVQATESDSNDWGWFSAVIHGRLWISYRKTASLRKMMAYDFSAGLGSNGMSEVLMPDGRPWGWSSPLDYNWLGFSSGNGRNGAIASVRKSTGLVMFTADYAQAALGQSGFAQTNCGMIAQFENGTYTDGSDNITGTAYSKTDQPGSLYRVRSQNLRIMYASPINETVAFYRRLDRTASGTITLAGSGAPFVSNPYEIAQRERTASDIAEVAFNMGTNGSGAYKNWGFDLEFEVDESFRGGV